MHSELPHAALGRARGARSRRRGWPRAGSRAAPGRTRARMSADVQRELLRHYLAALAYGTQKALRGADPSFASFRAGEQVRTPRELVRHMSGVLSYARSFFGHGNPRLQQLDDFDAEVLRFHALLVALSDDLDHDIPVSEIALEQLLQGPFSDAMTHAGQLAMLRRLSGDPVPPENFIYAEVRADHLGVDQPPPARPDAEWPEAP